MEGNLRTLYVAPRNVQVPSDDGSQDLVESIYPEFIARCSQAGIIGVKCKQVIRCYAFDNEGVSRGKGQFLKVRIIK